MMESKIRTIPKILLVPLMPLIFLFTMGDSCGNNQSSAPGNTNLTFSFEYDYMIGYDVFASTNYADVVYATCNTNLDIGFDENNIPATSIDWSLLVATMKNHRQKYLPSTCDDFIYPAYLAGFTETTNTPDPAFVYYGVTFFPPSNCSSVSDRFVAIFGQTIQSVPNVNNQKLLEKTVIHELGHCRGILTHLCLSGTTQHPAHNDPACVMGQGTVAPCTGLDVYQNPKFCPADIAFLKNVTW